MADGEADLNEDAMGSDEVFGFDREDDSNCSFDVDAELIE